MDVAVNLPTPIIFLTSLALCLAILRVAEVAGKAFELVDRPSERKTHFGDIPLVGGISIFLTTLVLQFIALIDPIVIFAGAVLIVVGIADDYLDLSPRLRLVVQAIAGAILIWGGYQITDLGDLLIGDVLLLSGLSAGLFTLLSTVGVVNAINMIDGADGLAGGVVAISTAALLSITMLAGAGPEVTSGLVVILGAVLAFLAFNSGVFGHSHKVFLGDSGSMFLGIVLASFYIGLSQGSDPYLSPVAAGWLFGLPLMDSVSVMVGRMLKGKSPLNAGRDHLHHRLAEKGFSSGRTVTLMLTLHTVLVLIGVIGNHYAFSASVMLRGFVSLVVAYHFMSLLLLSQGTSNSVSHKRRVRQ